MYLTHELLALVLCNSLHLITFTSLHSLLFTICVLALSDAVLGAILFYRSSSYSDVSP
jgi:hypothetical protein